MRAGPVLTTRIETRNGVTSVALAGELDMATVSILNQELATLERDGSRAIVLDIRDLGFIDSSGLHALVRAHQRAEHDGHRLLLVGANTFARRLCEMTGTQFLLDAKGTADVLGRFTGDGSSMIDRGREAGTEPHV